MAPWSSEEGPCWVRAASLGWRAGPPGPRRDPDLRGGPGGAALRTVTGPWPCRGWQPPMGLAGARDTAAEAWRVQKAGGGTAGAGSRQACGLPAAPAGRAPHSCRRSPSTSRLVAKGGLELTDVNSETGARLTSRIQKEFLQFNKKRR